MDVIPEVVSVFNFLRIPPHSIFLNPFFYPNCGGGFCRTSLVYVYTEVGFDSRAGCMSKSHICCGTPRRIFDIFKLFFGVWIRLFRHLCSFSDSHAGSRHGERSRLQLLFELAGTEKWL